MTLAELKRIEANLAFSRLQPRLDKPVRVRARLTHENRDELTERRVARLFGIFWRKPKAEKALSGPVRIVYKDGEPGPDFDKGGECTANVQHASPVEAARQQLEPTTEPLNVPRIEVPWDKRRALKETLSALGLTYVDHSPKGGCLWVVGGMELKQLMENFRRRGIVFALAPRPRATRGRAAWWTKDCR